MNPDLEKLLEEYVRGAPDRAASQATALERIFNQFVLHEQKDDSRFTQLLDAVRGHGSRLDKLEKSAEDTGSHNVAALQRELSERKARSWDVVKLIAAGAGTALLAMGTWLLGRLSK